MSAGPVSPAARLAQAQARVRIAQEQCPHWDYENDGACGACCDELDAAETELRRARAALGRDTGH